MKSATLIFPHQLFENHPAVEKERSVYLAEDPLFFGNDHRYPVAFHKQKLVLHRASMQAYTDELRGAGHAVNNIPHTATFQYTFFHDLTDLHIADVHDFILEKRIREFTEKRDITLRIHPTPAFLSPPEFLEEHIGSRKKPFMASFYQAQRKRMAILLNDDGNPEGGQWSFDEDNRKKLPGKHQPPAPPEAKRNEYVETAIAHIERHFPDNPGSTGSFRYPVTRADAGTWLKNFVSHRFTEFGDYEDAISTRHPFINHSLLTPSLNIGLLTPREIIDAALATPDIPINSLEGFVRQIIGWREFMHGIYRHRGVEIRNMNFLRNTRPIPANHSTMPPPASRPSTASSASSTRKPTAITSSAS